MKQESDYVLASRAIPGTLKTVEGFHMVDPDNVRLKKLLAEGYCQYASGFIEDEWGGRQTRRQFRRGGAPVGAGDQVFSSLPWIRT